MSNKSNARHSMELALTYLSRCEVNEGLNPRWTERAMKVTSDWKKKFTKYLVGKPQVWGCPEPGKAHTEETAKDLADRLIMRYYEEEKAARLEETTTKWHTRITEDMDVECGVTDPAVLYGMVSRLDALELNPDGFAAMEESVDEGDRDFTVKIIDWSERREKMAELRDDLREELGYDHRFGPILARAKTLAECQVILWKDYWQLKNWTLAHANAQFRRPAKR